MNVSLPLDPEPLNNQTTLLQTSSNDSIDSNLVQTESIINIQSNFIAENGETYTYANECFQRDGQLFVVFQNEKGEKTEVLCETNVVTVNDSVNSVPNVDFAIEINQNNTTTPVNEANANNPNQTPIETNLNNDLEEKSNDNSNPITESKVTNETKPDINHDSSTDVISKPNSSSQAPSQPPSQSHDKNSDTKSSSSISIQSIEPNPTQLAKSSKTYSRTSNIVWLSLPEKKDVKSKLTTTIEIADPDDPFSRRPIDSPNKLNAINSDRTIFPIKKVPENIRFTINEEMISVKYAGNHNKESIPAQDKVDQIKPVATEKTIEKSPPKRTYSRRLPPVSKIKENSIENNGNEIVKDRPLAATLEKPNESKTSSNNKKKVTFVTPEKKPPEVTSEKNLDQKTVDEVTELHKNDDDDSKYNFRRNDRRSNKDYCDFSLNHDQNSTTTVSIRMQPECRDEPEMQFHCDNCDFKTTDFIILKSHRNWCSFYRQDSLTSVSLENKGPNSEPILKKRPRFEENEELNISSNKSCRLSPKSEAQFSEISEYSSVDEDDEKLSSSDLDDNKEDEKETKSLNGFSVNQVVWVETRVGFWPALVVDVLINEARLLLRLINCPLRRESLKTSTKSLIFFDKPDVVNKFLKESKNSEHHNQLLKVVQRVEEYLRKRCLGENVNPGSFFNFSGFFESSNPSMSSTSKENDATSNNIQIDGTSIYQYIKEGNVEAHLFAIYGEGSDNERHRKFLENEKEGKEVEVKACFGPIKDEEQQGELFIYLSKLYENCSKKKHNSEDETLKSSEPSSPYIYSVWIPEAIIKSISKKHHVDIKKAEELYNQECSTDTKSG